MADLQTPPPLQSARSRKLLGQRRTRARFHAVDVRVRSTLRPNGVGQGPRAVSTARNCCGAANDADASGISFGSGVYARSCALQAREGCAPTRAVAGRPAPHGLRVHASVYAGVHCIPVLLFQPKYRSGHPENQYFHYLKKPFLDQSIKKTVLFIMKTEALSDHTGYVSMPQFMQVCMPSDQCCCFSRNIAQVRAKIIYLYDKKSKLQDQSTQIIINLVLKITSLCQTANYRTTSKHSNTFQTSQTRSVGCI